MGGINSGRSGGRPKIGRTACLVLDVNVAVRGIRPGQGRRGVWERTGGGDLAHLSTTVLLDAPRADFGMMCVAHGDMHGTGGMGPAEYTVKLHATPCHLGGRRWWFECPRTGRRCGKLYLPRGGHRLLSRAAYGLIYDVQHESPLDRAHRRMARVYRAVGADYHGFGYGWPGRPKGMHAQTFDRIASRLLDAERRLGKVSAVGIERVLARFKADGTDGQTTPDVT